MKNIKTILFILILSFILLFLIFFFMSINKFKLLGDKEITIPVFTHYEDLGYIYNGKVTIRDNIDINKIGTYYVKYEITNGVFKFNKKRIINVVDNIAPELTLLGDNEILVCPNNEYIEEGYIAVDNYDGDITNRVNIDIDKNNIVYSVIDSSGNTSIKLRNVIDYKTINAEIVLDGNQYETIFLGDEYKEQGYTIKDPCNRYSEESVIIDGEVNTNKLGTYYITYTLIDNSSVFNTRTIYVKPRGISKNSTIYLTFDDGPSNVTSTILDILREENVKATFFVVQTEDFYDSMFNRIVDEGHTIALHTYSHKYSQIYSSIEAFMEDLNNISDKVYNLTGIRSKIMRFAGGSSNTVSRVYKKGIMTELVKLLKEEGYKYYDWNVDSRDAEGSHITSEIIYNTVTSTMTGDSVNIVLMHDKHNNWNTVNALKNIIRWGKNNGYSFDRITENTPQKNHGINN